MIRKATLDDLDAIWELRLQTAKLLKTRGVDQWQSIFPIKQQFIDDINMDECYVLDINHHIIGMMAIKAGEEPTYKVIYDGLWHDKKPYLTIHRIAVHEDNHGQGYGVLLLNYAKNVARKLGYTYMRIDTHEDNHVAIKRFTTFGFKYCGYILLSKAHLSSRKRLAYDLILEVSHANLN